VADEDRITKLSLDDRCVNALDRDLERIRRGVRRPTMAWQIEGDRAPSRIECFELGQRGPPHRPVERQTMQEHDRGTLVGRADIIGRQAGIRRGRDRFGLRHLRSLHY
jgi:hypothetical protein